MCRSRCYLVERTTGDREHIDTPSTSREQLAHAASNCPFASPNSRTARKQNEPTRERPNVLSKVASVRERRVTL
jgi:hypothetical protein